MLQADRETVAEQIAIMRCIIQRQRRLPDTDSDADRPASEEGIRVGRPVPDVFIRSMPTALLGRLTAALVAARAVINNSVLPSSDDMSRVAAATSYIKAFLPMLLMQCFKKVRQQSREQLLQMLV